jgi:hypothetical protein
LFIFKRPRYGSCFVAWQGDEEALFAGSPTARYASSMPAAMVPGPTAEQTPGSCSWGPDWWGPGSRGRTAVKWGDVTALAATATPYHHSLARHINLAAEMVDPLDVDEITLQFVGYAPAHGVALEALGGRGGGKDTVLAPAPDASGGCMHFTFHLFSNQPTVTAAARPQLLPGGAKGRFCALVPAAAAAAVGEPGRQESGGGAAGVAVTLPLHPPELREQQLGQLEAQGLGEECRGSAARQLRLRAAQYLAERWLQVDVWDSTSLLQASQLLGKGRSGKALQIIWDAFRK